MEERLAARDSTRGDRWRDMPIPWLLTRLRQEVRELEVAADPGPPNCGCREAGCPHIHPMSPEEVRREAADVANFAMFIAEVAEERRNDVLRRVMRAGRGDAR